MDDKPVKQTGNAPKKLKDAESNKNQESFLASKALIYDVLSTIFKYLNGKDLCTAAMVCRSWRDTANDERRVRGPVYFSGSVCCSEPDTRITMEQIKTEVIPYKELTIKPKLAMMFLCVPVSDINDEACHCGLLPRGCNSIVISADGVIENMHEHENDPRKTVSVFLPEIPEVKLKTIVYCKGDTFQSNLHTLKHVFNMNRKKDSGTSNCLLLFSNEQYTNANGILYCLKQWYPRESVSIWGGEVNNLHICKSDENETMCCRPANVIAIALSGQGIKTWSTIIDKNCKTKEQVEKKLQSFKQNIQLKRHSLGLMFACLARGEQFYQEPNVESTIFKRLFPTVPLVGCFGYGEYGENTVSCSPENKFVNTYSSIFLIITYGR